MKTSFRCHFSIFLGFLVIISFFGNVNGQATTQVKKPVSTHQAIDPHKLLSLETLRYTGNITTAYAPNGNTLHRGVFIEVHKGTQVPEKWITSKLKLKFNGRDVPKMTHNYFFDDQVSSLSKNLEIKVYYGNNPKPVFSASGMDNPVSLTFPPEGYVYSISEPRSPAKKPLVPKPINKKGLKVSWTPTHDSILVWLRHHNAVIKTIFPPKNKNHVVLARSLFKPNESYRIRVRQKDQKLSLSGQFNKGSYVKKNYLIYCHISTR